MAAAVGPGQRNQVVQAPENEGLEMTRLFDDPNLEQRVQRAIQQRGASIGSNVQANPIPARQLNIPLPPCFIGERINRVTVNTIEEHVNQGAFGFVERLKVKVIWIVNEMKSGLKAQAIIISLIFGGIWGCFGVALASQAAAVYLTGKIAYIAWKYRRLEANVDELTQANRNLHQQMDQRQPILAGEIEMAVH